MFDPQNDALGFWPTVILHLCHGPYHADVIELPVFAPNEFMFTKFADKGKSRGEIYGWVIRDIISKVSKKPKIEVSAREKIEYKAFIAGKTNVLKKDGKIVWTEQATNPTKKEN